MNSHLRSIVSVVLMLLPAACDAELRVGAANEDVTPTSFPVLVNGGMIGRSVSEVNTPLSARAIVIDDGERRIAIVVVDSCMMPRFLLDDAKQLASQRTQIKPEHILISATHTHTAPSSMGALGTAPDERYVPYLREKLAQSIARAEANLRPAHVGWASVNAAQYTALRRWIRRPDRIAKDPFGNPTVRANMHAGQNPDDVTGESGPEDPELSIISFRTPEGKPIAVLANFSMHYFGDRAVSADYFGLFCNGFQAAVSKNTEDGEPTFVAALSHGCSGDIWRRDYRLSAEKRPNPKIEEFSDGLLELALSAYQGIQHEPASSIAMAELRMPMRYRVPDAQRLQWAQGIVAEMETPEPKTSVEVYAREQVILHELQSTEIVVQAIRIGDIGIATTPNETYALTGLKLKLQSPLKKQMVIELANGGDGYIPPPEQHFLGGYNTWAARSAGLEINAEPKIVEANLQLLEQVAGRERRRFAPTVGKRTEQILDAKPYAFWRMDDMAGPMAVDASSNHRDGTYEMGIAFFLEGTAAPGVCTTTINRSAHFAGGRLLSRIDSQTSGYTVAMWFYNGMPLDARPVAGWMFSRDHAFRASSIGDHLGLSGSADGPGRLIFQHGNGTDPSSRFLGNTKIDRWTWNHVALVREGTTVRVHLNGLEDPEITAECPSETLVRTKDLFVGGRCDNEANWEGRLDEVVLFDRPLSAAEISRLFKHP